MDIKKITIENWQCIDFLSISFEKLMILIGEGNRGKTSVINALFTVLGCRDVKEKDFKNKNKDIVIKLKYFQGKDGFLTLKYVKKIDMGEEHYLIDHGNEKRLTEEEFEEVVDTMKVVKMSSKEMKVKDSLEKIRDIHNLNLIKNEVINKDLESKINFLSENEVSYSLQRRILFSFFKNVLEEMKNNDEKKENRIYNTVLIFEEPELYLSPQASRELYSILIKLANIGIQIIIETHSSYFVGIKQYRSICLIKKILGEVVAFQHTGKLFNGDEIKNFNMNYWINPDRGEMFFAKKVILVEGQTDKIALSFLAKKLGVYKYTYSIIECGSKSIVPQFIKVLNAYKIPYVAVYDKDNHGWRTPEELENSNVKNKKIKKIINKHVGSWIEFENDIEEEIYCEKRERKNYKNKPYYTLQKISENDYIISERLIKKIKKIYE